MAYAFNTLRPLFRERGKINAEVTGRLTEALGGIRVVKSYTAEKREEIVFTKGAHRLFRNIAQVDDRCVGDDRRQHGHRRHHRRADDLARRPGGSRRRDDARRPHHLHLLHRPRRGAARRRLPRSARRSPKRLPVSIASAKSSTCRPSWTRTRQRAAGGALAGDVAFDDVWFEYNEGQPVLRGVSFEAARRDDDRARRIERLGQEHAHQPRHGVQPADPGPRARSTAATSPTCG